MYSAPSSAFKPDELLPILVREEPLRGLNATFKSTDDQKSEAVLQVVETAELRPGHEFLVLRTRLLVLNKFMVPHSCNQPTFSLKHREALSSVIAAGGIAELARRYALMLATGDWAWRNAMEAESVEIRVRVRGHEQPLVFKNVLLADEAPFDFESPDYATAKEALTALAKVIESALLSRSKRGTCLRVEAVLQMGPGARVYPSQEWASEHVKKESKVRWPGGEGVTRVLAKLPNAANAGQALINDRKVGNQLRSIDTWHGVDNVGPIPVEPYGASSHKTEALRKTTTSAFSLLAAVADGRTLTPDEGLFYAATCIRGGVFGVKEQ